MLLITILNFLKKLLAKRIFKQKTKTQKFEQQIETITVVCENKVTTMKIVVLKHDNIEYKSSLER